MKYNQPFGATDPDAPYVDRNTPGAVSGSVPPARALEHPQREIVAAIEAAGLTPDEGDLTQLSQAIGAMSAVSVFGTAANGGLLYPGGAMLQWGNAATVSNPADGQQFPVTWHTAFPTAVMAAWVSKQDGSGALSDWWYEVISTSLTGAVIAAQWVSDTYLSDTARGKVFAIGY